MSEPPPNGLPYTHRDQKSVVWQISCRSSTYTKQKGSHCSWVKDWTFLICHAKPIILQSPVWQAPLHLSSHTWSPTRPSLSMPATLAIFCLFFVSRTEISAMLLPLLGTIFFLFLTWLTPTNLSNFNHIQEINWILSFLHSLRNQEYNSEPDTGPCFQVVYSIAEEKDKQLL